MFFNVKQAIPVVIPPWKPTKKPRKIEMTEREKKEYPYFIENLKMLTTISSLSAYATVNEYEDLIVIFVDIMEKMTYAMIPYFVIRELLWPKREDGIHDGQKVRALRERILERGQSLLSHLSLLYKTYVQGKTFTEEERTNWFLEYKKKSDDFHKLLRSFLRRLRIMDIDGEVILKD